jgi:hypothetical protein
MEKEVPEPVALDVPVAVVSSEVGEPATEVTLLSPVPETHVFIYNII